LTFALPQRQESNRFLFITFLWGLCPFLAASIHLPTSLPLSPISFSFVYVDSIWDMLSFASSLLLRDFFHDSVPTEAVTLLTSKLHIHSTTPTHPTPHVPLAPKVLSQWTTLCMPLPDQKARMCRVDPLVPWIPLDKKVLPLHASNLEQLLDLHKAQSPHLVPSIRYLQEHTYPLSRILSLTCTSYHDSLTVILDQLVKHELIPAHRIRFLHLRTDSRVGGGGGMRARDGAEVDSLVVFRPRVVAFSRYFMDPAAFLLLGPSETAHLLVKLGTRLERFERAYAAFVHQSAHIADPDDRNDLLQEGCWLQHPLLDRLVRKAQEPAFTIRVTSHQAHAGLFVYGAHHARQVIGPGKVDWLFLREEWMPTFWKRLELHWAAFFYRYHYRVLQQVQSRRGGSDRGGDGDRGEGEGEGERSFSVPCKIPYTEAWTWSAIGSVDTEPSRDCQPDFPPSLAATAEVPPMLWIQHPGQVTHLWTSHDMCAGTVYEPVKSTHAWKEMWTYLTRLPDAAARSWESWLTIIIMDLVHILLKGVPTPPAEEALVEHWDSLRPLEDKENRHLSAHPSQNFSRRIHRKLVLVWEDLTASVRTGVGPYFSSLHWDHTSCGAYRFAFQSDSRGLLQTLKTHLPLLAEHQHLVQWSDLEEMECEERERHKSRGLTGPQRQRADDIRRHVSRRTAGRCATQWAHLKRRAWFGSTESLPTDAQGLLLWCASSSSFSSSLTSSSSSSSVPTSSSSLTCSSAPTVLSPFPSPSLTSPASPLVVSLLSSSSSSSSPVSSMPSRPSPIQDYMHSAITDLYLVHGCIDMLFEQPQWVTTFLPELEQYLQSCAAEDTTPLTLLLCLWFETFAPGSLYCVLDQVHRCRQRISQKPTAYWNTDGKWIGGGIPRTRGRQRRTRVVTAPRTPRPEGLWVPPPPSSRARRSACITPPPSSLYANLPSPLGDSFLSPRPMCRRGLQFPTTPVPEYSFVFDSPLPMQKKNGEPHPSPERDRLALLRELTVGEDGQEQYSGPGLSDMDILIRQHVDVSVDKLMADQPEKKTKKTRTKKTRKAASRFKRLGRFRRGVYRRTLQPPLSRQNRCPLSEPPPKHSSLASMAASLVTRHAPPSTLRLASLPDSIIDVTGTSPLGASTPASVHDMTDLTQLSDPPVWPFDEMPYPFTTTTDSDNVGSPE
jgi:hypothetical protein